MSSKYNEHKQLNLPAIGQEILAKWQQEHTFEQSVSLREGSPAFVFYEGPPSANGMPGIHHVISRTLKDLVCRYKTMQGFQVKRKGGWDTHGLPVELGVEKELGITKEDIGTKISVEEYNQKCREAVMRFKDKWDGITQQMGYWVDLNDPYITFENNYIESLWWCLSALYKKGYLYESVSIQPYSPAAGTGLSSHELNQPGTYKDVKDTSATVMFKVVDSSRFKVEGDVFIMAWTTTPWTLPSNLGLTVGPNIEYVLVKTFNPYTHALQQVILAKDLVHKYFKAEGENGDFDAYTKESKIIPYIILGSFTGKELEGLRYEQLIPGEANTLAAIQAITPGADPFRVVTGDFVTTTDGTGIVHTAPAFGADDFKVGKQNNLGILTLVDREGKFVPGLGDYSGRFVKNYKDDPNYVDVNVDISVELKLRGQAFKVEKYEHSYPHCWRTDKPIIYYPLDAWFIKTTALKDKMVEANKTINWKPKATGEGRFGNWLENMVDWNLSRSRFWGTPLPIWIRGNMSDKAKMNTRQQIVIGSVAELKKIGRYFKEALFTSDIQNSTGSVFDYFNSISSDNANKTPTQIAEEAAFRNLYNQIKNSSKSFSLAKIMHWDVPYEVVLAYSEPLPDEFDLHKPYIDNVVCFKDGNYYYRVPDLIDVWFDSGAMPYAQYHFPFENRELFAQNYPADFIAEGVDQTRGWFYTLHALAGLLQESIQEELTGLKPGGSEQVPNATKDNLPWPSFQANDSNLPWPGLQPNETKNNLPWPGLQPGIAYKNVVSNGLVLDKNGVKMSKRLGNVVDPFATIDQYGADPTRWYLITNANPWDSLKFDIAGIQEVQRKFFGTLYNTYQFFALYANVDGFAFKEAYIPVAERPELDRWILSALNTLVQTVQESMDDYEPTQAGRAIEEFTDTQLSNWYVRLCRRRFWKGEYEHDKICAYQTLYECLETLSRLIAPIAPFFADWLFGNLNAVSGRFGETSVHHVRFPKVATDALNSELEKRMALAQDASSLILSLRKKVNIKVRQPLQKVMIPALDAAMTAYIQEVADIIKAETNIKEVELLAADNDFIRKKAKANFKTLGKRLGGKMKWAADKIAQFTNADIEKVLQGPVVLDAAVLDDAGQPIAITAEDMEVSTDAIPGYEVAAKGSLTVALDITITDHLKKEGDAREFVNRIQNLRKEEGFALTDRINVKVSENQGLQASLTEFNAYICAEILADSLEFSATLTDGTEIEVNDVLLKVNVTKKGV